MNKKIKLFPYFFVRVCGGSLPYFDKLRLEKVVENIDELVRIEKRLKEVSGKTCDRIYKLAGKTEDSKKRYKLIQTKRDIFNLRTVPNKPILNKIEGFGEYRKLIIKHKSLNEKIKRDYDSSLKRVKRTLVKLASDEGFQKGLVLSSIPLYRELQKYLEDPFSKNQSKTELGLIKYLSRTYAKSTPYSTFTSVGLGRFSDRVKNFVFRLGKRDSHFQVNNAVTQFLERLMLEDKDYSRNIPIRLNETIREEDGQFVFIANDRNREAIQRIDITPALRTFIKLMSEGQIATINSLLDICMQKRLFTETPRAIEKYIRKLIDLGFIYYIHESITGMESMTTKLERVDAKKRMALIEKIFRNYRADCKQLYMKAGLPQRGLVTFEDGIKEEKKKAKHESKKGIFKFGHISEFTLEREQLFYEDTKMTAINKLPKDEVLPILNAVHGFLKPFEKFNYIKIEQKKMYKFYEHHFHNKPFVPLLDFYENYCKEFELKKGKGKQKKENKNYKAFCKNMAKRVLAQAGQTNNFVKIEPWNSKKKTITTACSAYLQFYQEDNLTVGVLNDLSNGYCRGFSRFLPMFVDDVVGETRRWNKLRLPNTLLVENNDASNFNANVHPPLLPYEIDMPGSRPNLPKKQQIQINRLILVKDVKHKRLELKDRKTLKSVLVFDLGFQGSIGRSGLFNFLNNFNAKNTITFPVKLREFLRYRQKDCVINYPRVYYGDRLVIFRQAWSISKDVLPLAKKGEKEAEHFLRINKWRISLRLPQRVFIRVIRADDEEVLSKKKLDKLLPDDRKPQYIDFTNPYLVKLFSRTINRVVKRLWVEEMLPDHSQILQFDGKPYVSEFIVQWKQ